MDVVCVGLCVCVNNGNSGSSGGLLGFRGPFSPSLPQRFVCAQGLHCSYDFVSRERCFD